MSVVIAAPQAKAAAPATPADSAASTDTAAAGADFASLLLGQLAAGAELQAQVPESAPAKTDDSSTASTESAPQDPALLLAALGMAPAAPSTGEAPQPGKADATLLRGSSGKESTAALSNVSGDLLSTSQKAETGDSSSEFSLPIAPGTDDKPAKVAVAEIALPKADALAAGSLAEEGRAGSAAAVAPHTPLTASRNEGPLKVETPVRDQNWAGDFSQKVVWLATNDKQFAQMTLNPPQMGPIEISLNINKDGASAFFVSQNADVREAIETALPRLREMLAGVGIELGQANVGAESFRQPAGSDDSRQGSPRWMADNAILSGDSARSLSGQAIIAQRGNGMVDTFA